MRLKEPLYGIRMAQMHYFIHLSLLIVMLVLEVEILKNPDKVEREDHKVNLSLLNMNPVATYKRGLKQLWDAGQMS
jgi:hypothetical protein